MLALSLSSLGPSGIDRGTSQNFGGFGGIRLFRFFVFRRIMKLCRLCLKDYKRKNPRRESLKNGIPWGKGNWPLALFHSGTRKLCEFHSSQSAADGASRRAAMLRAIPNWADRKKIRNIYAECSRISRDSGIKHEVDHIIPLRGAIVSGLHVHTNLRIIPASENRKKSNQYSP